MQQLSTDYCGWLLIRYKAKFGNQLAKQSCNVNEFKFEIDDMPPRLFMDIIFSQNNKQFDNDTLIIKSCKHNDNDHKIIKYHTTAADGGCCPKGFISWLFGDKNHSTIVVNKDEYQIDVCNCWFQYQSDLLVNFKLKSNIVYRLNEYCDWDSRATITNDLLPPKQIHNSLPAN